jgi:hypothetical protein
VSIYAVGCKENQELNRSIDYNACINSMAEEGLLKKSVVKKSGGGGNEGSDELINISFKCNFDFNYVEDVAKKIDFKIHDFLYGNNDPDE